MSRENIWRPRQEDLILARILEHELRISPFMARLITMRKVKSLEEARDFLTPSLKNLPDPLAFAGMREALKRLERAILSNEAIGIFGDYDVDGVCATALLAQFLNSIGATVYTTLPNRLKEGYGLSTAGVLRLKDAGAGLLITVDCGALAFEQIDYANSLGLEVVVIDHHNLADDLPKACSVINPKRSDCQSQADYLCAAGVAFFVVLGLRRSLRELGFFMDRPEPDVRLLLDLVSLATVCDVVPLIKHNRILVQAGLKMIKQGNRPGLSALIESANINAQKISSTNLGFHLGPRINAAGRLEDASIALRLIEAQEHQDAMVLAHMLEATNAERKAIEQSTVDEACAMVMSMLALPPAIVLYDERWHPGVVGIVASRVAERFHRPSIIIGESGKGSGRSIKGIDLHAMVARASASLSGFGGHAHAIGVSLKASCFETFRDDLVEVMTEHSHRDFFTKELWYDAEISLGEVKLALTEELARLEPFGAANAQPVMRINKCYMRNLRKLSGGHLKGELEQASGSASFIAFRTSISDELASCPLDILAVVEKNEWQGRESAQLRLIDYRALI